MTTVRMLTPAGTPLDPVPLTDRTQMIGVFDSNLRTGYVQNWSLSINRELPGDMFVDVVVFHVFPMDAADHELKT